MKMGGFDCFLSACPVYSSIPTEIHRQPQGRKKASPQTAKAITSSLYNTSQRYLCSRRVFCAAGDEKDEGNPHTGLSSLHRGARQRLCHVCVLSFGSRRDQSIAMVFQEKMNVRMSVCQYDVPKNRSILMS
jgi:hypothetical protein